jgi:hypothetical protein
MHARMDVKEAVQRTEVGHYTGCEHAHSGVSDAQGSLITAIGGSATAAGDSTAATGFIENFVQNKGHISIAMGEAIFLASAHSAEPGDALAAASTFLDIWGADIILEYESAQSTQGLHDASAASELDYFAIDIRGWSPPDEPIEIQLQQPFNHQDQSLGHEAAYGNFAQVFAATEAHGADTLSATFTNALTIENHFSFVNAVGIAAL